MTMHVIYNSDLVPAFWSVWTFGLACLIGGIARMVRS